MKVGLFGYYRYGNFGDDLMASLFFDDLREAGHEARACGLDPALAGPAGIETAANTGELAAWADCLVYGGGGVFLDMRRKQQADAELMAFLDARRERGLPLYAISVGGDAQSTFGKLTRAQQRLLLEADFITFRNPEDEKLAKEAGIAHFAIYPDMVWTAGRAPSASMGTGPICIEFSGTRHKALYYIAFAAARALTARKIVDVDLHWGRGERPRPGRALRNAIIGTEQYASIHGVKTLAGQSRCIFTSRLHFGLLGLASGSTTFLVHPASKARIVFERLGLGDYIIDQRAGMIRVIRELVGGEDAYPLSEKQQARIDDARVQAQGHFRKLRQLLS